MTLTLLKIAWAGLLPVALFFIALDMRTRFDRSFGFFGIAQLLLCAMTGIDLWILPGLEDPARELAWTEGMFVVGCLFALFYFRYMAVLTGWTHRIFIRILAGYAVLLSMAFFGGALLGISEGAVVRKPGFDFLFQPFMGLCLASALALMLRRFRIAGAGERRVLGFHLAGFLTLFVFGCLDVFFTYYVPKARFVSFNTLGSLSFGVAMSFIFLERLLQLIRERDRMDAAVRSALQEISQTRALRLVGENTAMLSHEIKNHVSVIRGNTLLADAAGLPAELRPHFERMRRAADGLQELTRGVLDAPAALSLAWQETSLRDVVERVLVRDFGRWEVGIDLGWSAGRGSILGDPSKLERVLANLLRNAGEAGARQVRIRGRETDRTFVIAIEDDGPGCPPEVLEELGKAFFTTKRNSGGTGLGICLSRAIVENHGGSLGIHAKNGLGGGRTGLLVTLVLPKPFHEGAPANPAPTLVAVQAPCPEMRARIAGPARNLQLVPIELAQWEGAAVSESAACGLILVEDCSSTRTSPGFGPGFPRSLWISPNGAASFRSGKGDAPVLGLYSEDFLAYCLSRTPGSEGRD